MSGGWYKQLRNIPERPWFKDANVVLLYTFLKATAYVSDGKYRDVIVRRGSCPTTRAEMMEATGLSYKQVDACLRRLIGYNEIFVKGYNKFSIVTICDYDACDNSNTLFDDYEVQQRYNKGTTNGTTKVQQMVQQTDFTPIIYNIKEERREEDTLISNSIPYKKEREYNDVPLEVKKRYNNECSPLTLSSVRSRRNSSASATIRPASSPTSPSSSRRRTTSSTSNAHSWQGRRRNRRHSLSRSQTAAGSMPTGKIIIGDLKIIQITIEI